MRLQTFKGQDSRPVVSFSSQKQASEFSSILGLPCHRFLFLQFNLAVLHYCDRQCLTTTAALGHEQTTLQTAGAGTITASASPRPALNSPHRLPGASSAQDRSRAGAASALLLLLAAVAPTQSPAWHVLLSWLRDGTTGGERGPPQQDGADVRSS